MGLEWNSPVFSVLFEAAFRSVVMAAAAGAILIVMRIRSSFVQHRLWSCVLAAMLLMPLLVLVVPHIGIPVLPRRAAAPDPQRVLTTKRSKPPVPVPTKSQDFPADTVPANPRPIPVPTIAEAVPVAPLTWAGAILLIYGIGAALLLVRLAAGWRAMHRLIQSSRPVSTPDGQAILESDAVFSPLTCGVVRPRVILPHEWKTWSETKLKTVLIHENAHVARRDPLIGLIAGVNRSVFWFHPLAWWLERHLGVLAEHACDDVVVAQTDELDTYATALVEIAEAVSNNGGRYVLRGLGAYGNGALRQRIDRLLLGMRPQNLSAVRKAAIALLFLLAVYTAAAGQLSKRHLDLPGAMAMLHSSNAMERVDATLELERIGAVPERRPAAIGALIELLKEPGTDEQMVWYGAVRLLGAMRAAEAADASGGKIINRKTPVATESLQSWALSQIGESETGDFTAVLFDGGAEARRRAADVLAWIGGDRAEQALHRARTMEKDKDVAIAIDVALYRFGEARDERAATNPQAIANRCLGDDEKDEMFGSRRFKARPIKTLFLDRRSQAVDETLCYESVTRKGYDRGQSTGWWLVTRDTTGTHAKRIAANRGPAGYSISDFIPSPDGKYLAVLSSAEGAPFIEVADLPAFVHGDVFLQLKTLPVWLDVFSLKGWNGISLLVGNATYLIGLSNPRMPLLSSNEQVFSWNVETGAVVPLSPELRNPLQYYCDGLSASYSTYSRASAVLGLRLLGDRAGEPCIEAALRQYPNDEDLKGALRYLRAQRSAATSVGRHLTVSGDGAARRLSLFYDREDINEEASIGIPPDITEESIERGLKNVVWDREGRNAAVAFERTEGSFVAAFIKRKDDSTVANDISRGELANVGNIGPDRVYTRRNTVPVEWQDWSEGRRFLVFRTQAWDTEGKRYTVQQPVTFDDSGLPVWK